MHWSHRNELNGIHYPGIYAIAISEDSLEGRPFELKKEISYFGMTNSIGGLRSRLNAFNSTISGKKGHGGAKRFAYKYPVYNDLVGHLYVSVHPIKCDPKTNLPSDLRKMGDVAKLEYEYFARYVEEFGALPEFNDQNRSPKK